MGETSSSSGRLNAIQILRGIAAIMVVLFHTNSMSASLGTESSFFANVMGSVGQMGVDIFFVISGFIIFITTKRDDKTLFFIKKRLIRILPLYWSLSMIYLMLFFVAPQIFKRYSFDLWHSVASLIFIPAIGPDGSITPTISYGWSLNYEMLFYSLFVPVISLKRKYVPGYFLGAYMLICIIESCVPDTWVKLKAIFVFYSNSIFLEFIIGMYIGYLFLVYRNRIMLFLVGIVAMACLVFFWSLGNVGSEARFIYYGMPAVIIFCLFLGLDSLGLRKSKFTYLGDISYSIYLIQAFTLPVLVKIFKHLGMANLIGINAITVLSVVITIISAIFTYILIEKKSQILFKMLGKKFLTNEV